MLNFFSDAEIAAAARAPFGEGAFPKAAVRTAQLCEGTVMFGRPRATWAADVIGQHRLGAGLGVALGQRNPGKQYQHTTRIVATSNGALGPHPAREPV